MIIIYLFILIGWNYELFYFIASLFSHPYQGKDVILVPSFCLILFSAFFKDQFVISVLILFTFTFKLNKLIIF